jgi:hypothetical protein
MDAVGAGAQSISATAPAVQVTAIVPVELSGAVKLAVAGA